MFNFHLAGQSTFGNESMFDFELSIEYCVLRILKAKRNAQYSMFNNQFSFIKTKHLREWMNN